MLRKTLLTMTCMLAAVFLAAGTASAADPPAESSGSTAQKAAPAATTPAASKDDKSASTKTSAANDEVAVMETSKGTMVFAFWPLEAPKTVENFKKLARQGFYDGTGFHRIIKGFMIQGGDPKSKNPKAPDLGTGDPGYKIPDEFNFHKHVPGVISMANSGTPNSAGSQFFIMDTAAPFLDGKYTAFGYMIDGMKTFKEIANTPVTGNSMMNGEKSKPLEWTKVISVKIVPKSSLKATEKAAASTEKAANKAAGEGTTKAASAATPDSGQGGAK
jgi:peptidyl-prolyl cis-trans isomerase B (cyclophilin B)